MSASMVLMPVCRSVMLVLGTTSYALGGCVGGSVAGRSWARVAAVAAAAVVGPVMSYVAGGACVATWSVASATPRV